MAQMILIYTTWPDVVEAETAGQQLIEQRLAACVNILPTMRSLYRWEGRIEKSEEVVMLIKTTRPRSSEVFEAVNRMHPSRVPAIFSVPVEAGLPSFFQWIEDGVKK